MLLWTLREIWRQLHELRREEKLSHCASPFYSELRKISLHLLLRLFSFVVWGHAFLPCEAGLSSVFIVLKIKASRNMKYMQYAEWGTSGQRHAQTALSPEDTRYPLYWKLGEPQGMSGPVRGSDKFLPPSGLYSRACERVVSCYTDWATMTRRSVVNFG
jgi:hypothetical protein